MVKMSSLTPQALSLYKKILRAHSSRLPYKMRLLGDDYVRAEFRRHRDAKPEFMATFVGEWERYLHQVEGTDGFQVGADLSMQDVESMSDEQKAQLSKLREETRKVRDD